MPTTRKAFRSAVAPSRRSLVLTGGSTTEDGDPWYRRDERTRREFFRLCRKVGVTRRDVHTAEGSVLIFGKRLAPTFKFSFSTLSSTPLRSIDGIGIDVDAASRHGGSIRASGCGDSRAPQIQGKSASGRGCSLAFTMAEELCVVCVR